MFILEGCTMQQLKPLITSVEYSVLIEFRLYKIFFIFYKCIKNRIKIYENEKVCTSLIGLVEN